MYIQGLLKRQAALAAGTGWVQGRGVPWETIKNPHGESLNRREDLPEPVPLGFGQLHCGEFGLSGGQSLL
jgi:hypothetical protein